jgi:hypothetical protein
MLTIPQGPSPLSTVARDATMLELEDGHTVAASETTVAALPTGAVPLRPARDPLTAGRTVRVEWAGRCRACEAPIWASEWPVLPNSLMCGMLNSRSAGIWTDRRLGITSAAPLNTPSIHPGDR